MNGILRLLLFGTLSSGLLVLLEYVVNDSTWERSLFEETWTKTDYQVVYTTNDTLSWTSRLAQGWTGINFNVIDKRGDQYSYEYVSSMFYLIVPDELLRMFTFNILKSRTLNLTINVGQPMSVHDALLSIQSSSIKGVLNYNDSYYSVYENYSIDYRSIQVYATFFYILNILLVVFTASYIVYLMSRIKTNEWWIAMKSKSLVEFSVICLGDNIYDSDDGLKDQIVVTILHVIFTWIIPLLLIIASYYSSYSLVKIIIFWMIVAYITATFAYLIKHYFNLTDALGNVLKWIYYISTGVIAMGSLLYLINVCLWVIIGIAIDVTNMVPFAIILFSIIVYVIQLPSEIAEIRKDLTAKVAQRNGDLVGEVAQAFRNYGFNDRDVAISLICGSVLVIVFSIFVIITWYIINFTFSLGQLVSSLTVPILAYSSKQTQISSLVKQIEGSSGKASENVQNV